MDRSKLYRLDGVVLGRRDHGEADRVIILLSKTGRIDLLAKGVRKPRSRKGGHLEMFNRVDVLCSRVQSSWDIISQAEATVSRPGLQTDLTLGTYARYVAELALRFFEDADDPELFPLVNSMLDSLITSHKPLLLIRWYEQQLLQLAGFRPEWRTCVGERDQSMCDVELKPKPSDTQPYAIDPERGGALCVDCAKTYAGTGFVLPISPSALSWLQSLQRLSYDQAAQYDLPQRTSRELAKAMETYIAFYLERRPASLRVIEDARRTQHPREA